MKVSQHQQRIFFLLREQTSSMSTEYVAFFSQLMYRLIMKPLSEDTPILLDFWKKELNFILIETMAGLAKMKDLLLLLGYDKKANEIDSIMEKMEHLDSLEDI